MLRLIECLLIVVVGGGMLMLSLMLMLWQAGDDYDKHRDRRKGD